MDETPLSHFSFRELLGQRSLAERAISRGRNLDASHALVARIDAELDRRRKIVWERRSRHAPYIDGFSDRKNASD
ncbi:MAG: hypothetical protein AAFR21_00480 [Pseudomonadota bacterium]